MGLEILGNLVANLAAFAMISEPLRRIWLDIHKNVILSRALLYQFRLVKFLEDKRKTADTSSA